MTQTPEQIAASLTKAQREALLEHRTGSWPEIAWTNLPQELFGPSWCGFAHLTSLGQQVRAILEKNNER